MDGEWRDLFEYARSEETRHESKYLGYSKNARDSFLREKRALRGGLEKENLATQAAETPYQRAEMACIKGEERD